MGELTLVVGGQKAGKSSAALRVARRHGAPPILVAPADATDGELAERIARHRADRDPDVLTVEGFEVADYLADPAWHDRPAIVDALDTWLLDAMGRHGLLDLPDDAPTAPLGDDGRVAQEAVLDEVGEIAAAAAGRSAPTVVVAGAVGMGPHGATPLTRRYEDLHGLALQALGRAATDVLLVVAGRALRLQDLDDLPAPPA